uniref:Uncharacterized protein n=1 Tax=Arundo donax TaxID=35708 RepID=A0A0A9GQB9_ARUDO
MYIYITLRLAWYANFFNSNNNLSNKFVFDVLCCHD